MNQAALPALLAFYWPFAAEVLPETRSKPGVTPV
jgi:hypothetical protein